MIIRLPEDSPSDKAIRFSDAGLGNKALFAGFLLGYFLHFQIAFLAQAANHAFLPFPVYSCREAEEKARCFDGNINQKHKSDKFHYGYTPYIDFG